MVIRLIVRLLVLAAAIWLTAWLLPGFDVTGGFFTYLWIAALYAVVNLFLGPLLHLISLPVTVLTLGLFALVVNAALVGITALLTDDLSVSNFWAALFAAIIISIVSAVLRLLLRVRN
jgi:putative membrane protein